MKTWWTLAFGVLGGLLAAATLWLIASPPRGQPVILRPPPGPAPVTVHVAGAVANPGVYSLPPDSRVREAVAAAGGLLPAAQESALNLAARLEDGAQVQVPVEAPEGPAEAGGLSPAPAGRRVDINTASQGELESLPGIGPATAEKIIAYRQEHGPFASPEAIQRVSGIGPATFERLRDLITVAPP